MGNICFSTNYFYAYATKYNEYFISFFRVIDLSLYMVTGAKRQSLSCLLNYSGAKNHVSLYFVSIVFSCSVYAVDYVSFLKGQFTVPQTQFLRHYLSQNL